MAHFVKLPSATTIESDMAGELAMRKVGIWVWC